jgi:hypothetical protein
VGKETEAQILPDFKHSVQDPDKSTLGCECLSFKTQFKAGHGGASL